MKGRFRSFLLGGLLGAVIALLYAPKSGEQTREDLRKKFDEFVEQGKESYEGQKERVLKAVDSGTQSATQASDELKKRIQEARSRLKDQVDAAAASAKEKISLAADKAKEFAEEEKGARAAEESEGAEK